jgi:hypothetical protein
MLRLSDFRSTFPFITAGCIMVRPDIFLSGRR